MKGIKMKKLFAFLLLAMLLVSSFIGCAGDDGNALPPVVTQGIPEEKVKSTIVANEFTIDIHTTYAEIKAYAGKETEPEIPESAAGLPVKLIGEEAFKNNLKITRITLPKATISIDRYAFEGCSSLTEVVFNDGLESISDYAFRNSGLTVLNLPDSVSKIGKYSFYGVKITHLKIPANVSRLNKYAFYGCSELKEIEFCERLYEISENSFAGCTSLTEIIIPKTVTKIEGYAFSYCSSLTKIVIPGETENIGEGVFVGCSGLTVYAPEGSEAERISGRNNYKFEACDYDAAAEAEGEK